MGEWVDGLEDGDHGQGRIVRLYVYDVMSVALIICASVPPAAIEKGI